MGRMRSQVGDDNTVERPVKVTGRGDEGEVGVAAVVEVAHVHPAVEHYPLPVDGDDRAALAHLLPCT